MRRARSSQPGLGRVVTLSVIALAAIALTGSAALIILTSRIHRSNEILRESVDSIRLADAAALQLLLHDRLEDEGARAEAARNLRTGLEQARDHVSTSGEGAALARAVAGVERYLAEEPGGRPVALLDAYRALDGLMALNVARAEEAGRRSARWSLVGDAIGGAGALVLVAGSAALLLWLRRRVVRPLLELGRAMERYGAGARDTRVDEAGAAELREMAERFNATAAALSRAEQLRLQSIAGIAHDLRNPLAALQLSTSLIPPESPLPPEPRVRQTLGIMHRQVSRLARMVDDLLDASRIEAGQLELRLEDRPVEELVREVVELFEPSAPGHSLVLDLSPEPLIVRCDPLRIEQALTNLVSNAVKYSPGGGTIVVATRAEEGAACLSVSDQGSGISAEDLPRIWEPFRRVGPAQEATPGVGLGLSITRRIVEAHGGSIEVRSIVGAGSTFTIRLPLGAGVELPSGRAATPRAPLHAPP